MLDKIDENLLLFSSKFAGQKEYWEDKLPETLTVTGIALKDKNGSPPPGSGKERIDIHIPGDLAGWLENISKGSDLSIYMVFLTALKVLIYRYAGNGEPVVVSPVYRPKVSGDTINDCVFIRDTVHGDMTFKELLLHVRRSTMGAYDNQDYPSAKLIEQLFPAEKNPGPGLISNILCLMENIHDKDLFHSYDGMLTFSFLREERGLRGHISYSPAACDREYMEQAAGFIVGIVEEGKKNIDVPLHAISLLSDARKRRLLFEFNDTGGEPGDPPGKTIHRLFEEQVRRTPDAVAVNGYYGSYETYKSYITFSGLNRAAHRLAGGLKERGVGPGKIAALLVDRSIGMIVAIMAVLKTGAAYMPVDPEAPEARKNYFIEDSNAGVLLTQRPLLDNNRQVLRAFPPGNVFLVDGPDTRPEPAVLPGENGSAADPAYLIYTSGTTGKPKGVVVEHRNVTNLVSGLKERIYRRYEGALRVCMLSPYVFDASVKQVFAALLLGHGLYIVPETARIDGSLLLEFYEKYKIDVSDGTPTHIGILARAMEEREGTQEINVRHFIIGGEALSRETVDDFYKHAGTPKIANVYGPTECCVDTAFYEVSAENRRLFTHIPLGKPMPHYRVYILGARKELVPAGVAGELCVAGRGTARGYLNAQELTRGKFIENPFDENEKMYCSGDLARWMPDGNIAFLGRADHQVKIRGYRIEPGEIEHLLLDHKAVKETVVAAREEKKGEKYLCAYIVPDRPGAFNERELREYLSVELADYMIPSYFMEIESIPLTPNGKTDRRALPVPQLGDTGKDYIAPRDEGEEKMAGIWGDVLEISKTLIGIDSNFFQLGGHSLKATILAAKIHRAFDVKLHLGVIFGNPTIRELSGFIKNESVRRRYISIEPTEKRDYYPLSSAQKRLYVLQQMEPEGTFYNMPLSIPIHGDPAAEKDKLENTFKRLIARHESLRTSFHMVEDEPVQRVHDSVEFEIEYYDLDMEEGSPRGGVRPFDLSRAPLLRAALVTTGEETRVLLVDMHHIIADGVSHEVLEREYAALYRETALPPLRLQYKDFSQWQNRMMASGVTGAQRDYWLERFKEKIPAMNLPGDASAAPGTPDVGQLHVPVGKDLSRRIDRYALETGATIYMVFLAALNVLLSKYMDRDDILVGTPVFGRNHLDLQNIIGMFVNMLVMRNFPRGDKTFAAFLEEVRQNALDAYENQDYQYEQLVWELEKRSGGENRLEVNIVFLTDSPGDVSPDAPDARETETPADPDEATDTPYKPVSLAKFDITLVAIEMGDEIILYFKYKNTLFTEQTIRGMGEHLKNILEEAVGGPRIEISGINMLTEEEKDKLVKEMKKDGPAAHGAVRPGAGKPKVDFDF